MSPIFFFIMKKIKAEFIIDTDYLDNEGKKQTAAVILKIDYLAKSFNILSSVETDFVFKNGNKNSTAMWFAIGQCIQDAVAVVNKELYDQVIQN